MNGYVAQRRGRFYAVIYEGLDPITGKERRRWYPAGTDRAAAERLAAKLAAEETTRIDAVRSLTFGAYLTSQWLPAKKLHLATSTHRGYERNVRRHVLPALGRSASGGCGTSRSRRSTTRCSTPRPAPVWRRRPSTRSTSSSAARSPTPTAGDS
ncbi:MAG: N-terminal phage integrase SAM-like domain-containing protein [Acidimicrobiia bacterium]|nr:N-terminal phage integrase SAM-like domain-containing protein [Acidimicrobiia bacterium]